MPPRTKTESALADAEQAHADDPERADNLRRARTFKTSWIELAEALTTTRRSGRWKEWGFESLEAYAKSELHLKPETVDKLTGSFSFLQRRAPAVLTRDPLREPMPSYHSVDFLRRAEESEGAPREAVEALRHRVIEEAAPITAISRAYKDTVFPVDEETLLARDLAGVKNVAKRLKELLGETKAVPRKLAGEVGMMLEQLLEAIEDKEEAA
jgi:hypothetical protein